MSDDDAATDIEWEPFAGAERGRLRVLDTSCCGSYEWATQGGQYVILREVRGRREEAGRSALYGPTREMWGRLVMAHRLRHRTRQHNAS